MDVKYPGWEDGEDGIDETHEIIPKSRIVHGPENVMNFGYNLQIPWVICALLFVLVVILLLKI